MRRELEEGLKMSTAIAQGEPRVLLWDISWATFKSLALENQRGARLTYDRGSLEIMSPSPEHQRIKTLTVRAVWNDQATPESDDWVWRQLAHIYLPLLREILAAGRAEAAAGGGAQSIKGQRLALGRGIAGTVAVIVALLTLAAQITDANGARIADPFFPRCAG